MNRLLYHFELEQWKTCIDGECVILLLKEDNYSLKDTIEKREREREMMTKQTEAEIS